MLRLECATLQRNGSPSQALPSCRLQTRCVGYAHKDDKSGSTSRASDEGTCTLALVSLRTEGQALASLLAQAAVATVGRVTAYAVRVSAVPLLTCGAEAVVMLAIEVPQAPIFS